MKKYIVLLTMLFGTLTNAAALRPDLNANVDRQLTNSYTQITKNNERVRSVYAVDVKIHRASGKNETLQRTGVLVGNKWMMVYVGRLYDEDRIYHIKADRFVVTSFYALGALEWIKNSTKDLKTSFDYAGDVILLLELPIPLKNQAVPYLNTRIFSDNILDIERAVDYAFTKEIDNTQRKKVHYNSQEIVNIYHQAYARGLFKTSNGADLPEGTPLFIKFAPKNQVNLPSQIEVLAGFKRTEGDLYISTGSGPDDVLDGLLSVK